MAGNTFYLKIISANRVFFSGRCRSLIVPEYDGQKEILAHHEDMVIAIDEGESELSSFDDFVKEWKQEGGDEIIQEMIQERKSLSSQEDQKTEEKAEQKAE